MNASMRIVDIVIPVFGNLEGLKRCVASVQASTALTPCNLVIVNDGDPDTHLARYLSGLVNAGTTVLHQPTRQGFAAAVNRGIAAHRDRDVVVLHSDAEVANDWLDRLQKHAAAADVGVVGTVTNVVGTGVYPVVLEADGVDDRRPAQVLDAMFARANAGEAVELPFVSGPALFFSRKCLGTVGALDANPIGGDYAVEVDFCLRASSAGFRHLLAGDVFVMHAGHGSFGAADGPRLIAGAENALTKLYPSYADELKNVAARDPVRAFARRVDLLRLSVSPKRVLLFMSHPWGGGIRRYMNDLAAIAGERCEVLFLEPAVGDTVRLTWPTGSEGFALYFTLPQDMGLLVETLQSAGVERLHVHHVHLLPQAVLELPRMLGIPYDYSLHDYHPICPQYHLVTEDGRYCGEPDVAGCTACLARRPAQWGLDIVTWRAEFARLLRGADRVVAPSHDVATRMHRYLPDLSIAVWSHPERAAPLPASVVRVAILGNLSPEKGLHVVAACARDARERSLPLAFRVLGSTTEPIDQAPDSPLTIYGQYVDSELPQLIAAEKPDVLLFAAQVPETFAYTLSVALQSGLPIVASALGAFPERLAGVDVSTTVPWDAPAKEWNDALLRAANMLDSPRIAATEARLPGAA